MTKRIQTVNGPIPPEKLGITLSHEHIIFDLSLAYPQPVPAEPSMGELLYQDVLPENRGDLMYNLDGCIENQRQLNIKLAVEETLFFKNAGGSAIVDVTSIGLSRDPLALLAVSRATGLNVVAGSGYYVPNSYSNEMVHYIRQNVKNRIADLIIEEFSNGIGNTGIKPGVIGEVGVMEYDSEGDLKVFRASAIAQKEIGAPMYIHCYHFDKNYNALDLLDIAEGEKADISKIVVCHCDENGLQADFLDSIAKRGASICLDRFGFETPMVNLIRDTERVNAVKEQIKRGNLSKILISHDVCFKTCLVKYGGYGYRHIPRNIIPMMKNEGITDKEIETILLENPRRLLTF